MGKLECPATTSDHLETQEAKHKAPNKEEQSKVLIIATLNVRTLRTTEREIELDYALEDTKFDVIGLSEIRRTGESIIEKENGNLLSYVGQTRGQKGVGFLIHKDAKKYIQEIVGISERISVLKLNPNGHKWTIIQVYAPTESSTDEEIEDFYEKLENILVRYKTQTNIIIGDFNSKVGIRTRNDEQCTGPHGLGSRNERGERLIRFAQENNMKIANTYFKKKPSSRWTWQAPNGRTRNEIDYILCDRMSCMKNIQIVDTPRFDTDHRLVKATMKIKKRKRQRPQKNKTEMNKDTFMLKLQQDLEQTVFADDQGAQELYNSLESCLTQASATASKEKPRSRNKLSQNTIALIEQRALLSRTRRDSERKNAEYLELDKKTKREIRKDLRDYRNEITRSTLENFRSVRKAKKRLYQEKQWITGVRKCTGERTSSRSDIVEAASDYYKHLYSSTIKETPPAQNRVVSTRTCREAVPPILPSEVRNAIKDLKNEKAPGEDGIRNEAIKWSSEKLTAPIVTTFNKILETEEIPQQWKKSTIVLMHKKGARDDLNNYRPISLLPNLYKLFTKILTKRLTKILDENQPAEQAGFRAGYSTADHLQSVNQILEKATEFNIKMYIAFIDYNKAFDSVEQTYVLQALSKQGVEHKYISILSQIYNQNYAKIKTEREGEPFPLERGVKQGDPISPKLFTAVLEDIFRNLKWAKRGVNINGSKISDLRFADDIILFANTARELQEMINELDTQSKRIGLSMNNAKTKLMTNAQEIAVRLDAKELQYTSEYIYLGQLVAFKDSTEKEIKRRIASTWKAFWSLKFILLEKKINRRLKFEALETCVFPVLLYGCQTWTLREKERAAIQICQRKMQRKILGISIRDRTTNETLQKLANIPDAAERAMRTKWKWGGHVARLHQARWTHVTTMWDPYTGKRGQGRPRLRWSDMFRKLVGKQWSTKAKDRTLWKELGQTHHSLGMTHQASNN